MSLPFKTCDILFKDVNFEIVLKAFYWKFSGPFRNFVKVIRKNSSPKRVYQTIGIHESLMDPLLSGLPKMHMLNFEDNDTWTKLKDKSINLANCYFVLLLAFPIHFNYLVIFNLHFGRWKFWTAHDWPYKWT